MLDIADDEPVDRFRHIGRRIVDDLAAGIQHLVHFHGDDGDQQIALVLVVVVDRANRDLGHGGDSLDLGALIARFSEKL